VHSTGTLNVSDILNSSHLGVKGREAGVYSALQLEEADFTLTP
jgi:hypothetical protein